jgi:hypothetical protein
MKKLSILLLVALSAGCAHTRVERWAGNQIEICGRHASVDDLVKEAKENGCVNPKPVAGRTMRDGGATITTTTTGANVSAKRESCMTFECAK